MALLEVDALTTTFETEKNVFNAVDGVSFTVEDGEVLGLVGESGSGKSVTAFSVLRLVAEPGAITGGTIRFAGENLTSKDARSMRSVRGTGVSMIFQEPLSSLNPVYTIGAQVMEPLLIHTDLDKTAAKARAIAMLKRVGIPDAEMRFSVYPHQLSGGLRQRVMIAIALVCEPRLLIADEPTTALDVTIQAQIIDLLKDLQAELGMAIIMITHDLGVIAEIADRVAVMYAGQIVEMTDVATLFDDPRHPYTAALLQSIPDRHEERRRLLAIEGNVPSPLAMPEGCRFASRCHFSKAICTSESQVLQSINTGHEVACIRAQRGELPKNLTKVLIGSAHE